MNMSPRTINEIIENKQQFLREFLLDFSEPECWEPTSIPYQYTLKGGYEHLHVLRVFVDRSGLIIKTATSGAHLLREYLGTDLSFQIGQLYIGIMDYYFGKVIVEMFGGWNSTIEAKTIKLIADELNERNQK